MKNITETITYAPHVRTVVMTGFAILGVVIALYVYFVGAIVFDVVARRSAEHFVMKEGGDVALLEATYYEKTKQFDLAYAETIGFSESKKVLYAKRDMAKTVGMVTHGF